MTIQTLLPNQSSLPTPQSTSSYWHKNPSERLLKHRTTPSLPSSSPTIIIGSGITGAFAARELIQAGKDVLLLEAREACWGATGRNGGHCQPMVYLSRPNIARFELATYNFLRDLITSSSIPCNWRTLPGVHSIYSPTVLSLVKTRISQLKASHPALASKVHFVTEPAELRRLRLRENAIAAVVQDCAASVWPYKLVSHILTELLEGEHKGVLNLQTNTPVTHLQRVGAEWIVHTDRGQVSSPNVILATNAYTSYLLPKLTNVITPVRGQVAALIPPEGSEPLVGTHVWSYKQEGDAGESDDYLVQAPTEHLILGGERMAVEDGAEGVSDDSEVDPVLSKRLHSVLSSTLQLSDSDPEVLKSDYEWTGIMGYSTDGGPWVGQVPEGLGGGHGLWISAGYTGHGMPVAARCGIAVAERIMGRETVQVPKEWEVSEERVQGLKNLKMPDDIEGELRALVQGGL